MIQNSKNGNSRSGTCKLTLKDGPFVKSHVIPKALTLPTYKGKPFLQFHPGGKPVRRWSSWYDSNLVTREGEDILTEFDTWAITELRRHKLIWSSWGKKRNLGSLHTAASDTPWGRRKIAGIDPTKLRLFFLSLLWRAASTTLPEFAEVQLPQEDLETLRKMIVARTPEPVSFYPTTLIQLSTIGAVHNYAPIAQIKEIPSLEPGEATIALPIFRFYFDGLIAHMHRQSSDDGYTAALGSLVVGAADLLVILTQTYEASFQRHNLITVMSECKTERSAPES
jgi:hypothetical protein